jgi:succinoglycan biosynthesis protein ExoM
VTSADGASSAAENVGTTRRPVLIAMLTYRRPADLTEAVTAVLRQLTDSPNQVRLLVVDNDPAGSAAAVIATFDQVHYVHEPRPGIAAARNRALDETADDELLIFIDDDERPCDGWLDLMLTTHSRFGCAAVVGAVVSEYEVEPDEWIKAGRFFKRRRLPTGTRVDVAATNNLLLDTARVRRLGLRFDERFGQSGGSDTLFTRQLAASGEELVWCDEAVVVDRVPAARVSRRWVVRRSFRSGNSWTRTSLALAKGRSGRLRARLAGLAIGSLRLAGGLLKLISGTVAGSLGVRARGIRTMARGAGMWAGATGFVYSEYERTQSVARREKSV